MGDLKVPESTDTTVPYSEDARKINDALQRQLASPPSGPEAQKPTRGLSPAEGQALTRQLERTISRAMGRR